MTGDATDVGSASPDLASRPFPLWLLYALSLATFGLYLPFWIRRVATAQGAGAVHRHTPTWWALGSPCPPIGFLVLYALAARAHEHASASGIAAGISPRVPALLFAALVLLFVATPLGELYTPLLLLAPIPFLLVQAMLNSGARGAVPAQVAATHRTPGWRTLGLLAVGLPSVVAALWWLDRRTLPRLLQSPFEVNQLITGDTAVYRLSIPAPGWRRVARGTLGDGATDLELFGPEPGTWVVVYVNEGAGATLDKMVDTRRSLIFDSTTIRGFEERRRFLDEPEPVVASLATYRAGATAFDQGIFVVLSAVYPTRSVEVIGFSQHAATREAELLELVESFEREGSPTR